MSSNDFKASENNEIIDELDHINEKVDHLEQSINSYVRDSLMKLAIILIDKLQSNQIQPEDATFIVEDCEDQVDDDNKSVKLSTHNQVEDTVRSPKSQKSAAISRR